jgi:hypothetical protein
MNPALQTLLQRADIWRANSGVDSRTSPRPALPSGFAALDRALRGGWPSAALTELLLAQNGVGELGLLLPLLSQKSASQPSASKQSTSKQSASQPLASKQLDSRQLTSNRSSTDNTQTKPTALPIYQIWIDPPLLPYAPALLQQGVQLDNVLIVYPGDRAQWLWSCVQALRSGSSCAVLCWSNRHRLRYADLRQLQVTASAHGSLGFLLRDLTQDRRILQHNSPAPLRLHLRASSGALHIEVLKQRGSAAGQQISITRAAALQAQTPLRKRNVTIKKLPLARAPQSVAATLLPEAHWR